MDPERFMNQVLKFPGPCIFFPPTADLHFLLAGNGSRDHRGPMTGAQARLGGKALGCPPNPYTHLVTSQMRRPRPGRGSGLFTQQDRVF